MAILLDKKQIEWIENLIRDTEEAGNTLILKLIVGRIMEEYSVEQSDAITMCTKVMQQMNMSSNK